MKLERKQTNFLAVHMSIPNYLWGLHNPSPLLRQEMGRFLESCHGDNAALSYSIVTECCHPKTGSVLLPGSSGENKREKSRKKKTNAGTKSKDW